MGLVLPTSAETAGGLHTASEFRLPNKTCWVNIVPCVSRIGQVILVYAVIFREFVILPLECRKIQKGVLRKYCRFR